jgi:hypothetical protein
MSTAPSPKLVAPGEGRRLALCAVKFGYKVESADSGGSLAVMEVAMVKVIEMVSPAGLETYSRSWARC